jgi:hypothetical protein
LNRSGFLVYLKARRRPVGKAGTMWKKRIRETWLSCSETVVGNLIKKEMAVNDDEDDVTRVECRGGVSTEPPVDDPGPASSTSAFSSSGVPTFCYGRLRPSLSSSSPSPGFIMYLLVGVCFVAASQSTGESGFLIRPPLVDASIKFTSCVIRTQVRCALSSSHLFQIKNKIELFLLKKKNHICILWRKHLFANDENTARRKK